MVSRNSTSFPVYAVIQDFNVPDDKVGTAYHYGRHLFERYSGILPDYDGQITRTAIDELGADVVVRMQILQERAAKEHGYFHLKGAEHLDRFGQPKGP